MLGCESSLIAFERDQVSWDGGERPQTFTSLTDALSHTTSCTYDTFDRVATRTDPLQQTVSRRGMEL